MDLVIFLKILYVSKLSEKENILYSEYFEKYIGLDIVILGY